MTVSRGKPDAPGEAGGWGLRGLAGCGGCAAKADPAMVAALAALARQAGSEPAAVLCGLDPADDAAVYKLDDDRALVSTLDFFPPLVDDPSDYGAIAAANALGDVYAMGGEVAFALVICGFPASAPRGSAERATAAAAEVVAGCGGVILGGHSIRCAEPVFGLAVTGFVHPGRIWRKGGAQPGDVLMLSKPLGTGVLLSRGAEPGLSAAIESMRRTNREAARALRTLAVPPSAVTDVTGYGLAGHAFEMAERSQVHLQLRTDRLPLLTGALEAAAAGVRTSADGALQASLAERLDVAATVSDALRALCHDPQTSGGLLAAVAPRSREQLEARGFVAIGRVEPGAAGVALV